MYMNAMIDVLAIGDRIGAVVRHTPMERFGWEQLVRRAELPATTKLVALTLATFANPGGGRVRPGERLLADCCGYKERAVREHLALLREAGLIECVFEGSRGRAAVYQLTIPGMDAPRVPMRVDPDGDLLIDRPVGRRGPRRLFTGTPVPVENLSTGTGVPVNGSDDRHPGAADPDDDRHRDAESPAPPRTMTGTGTHDDRHPGAAHHTDHTDQPRPTSGTLVGYVTYAAGANGSTQEIDHSARNGIGGGVEWRSQDTEYAEARRLLDHSPSRDPAMTQARMEFSAEGRDHPQFREIVLRAAAVLAREGNES